jgi:predicted ATPase
MIEQVIINNYKSIRELQLPLSRLNILIGSNGVGKSNFISFFELTKAIYEQRLGNYIKDKGGIKLSIADSDKLQSIVWNQIWEHHLVIDLLKNPYDYTQDRDSIRLIKTPVRE